MQDAVIGRIPLNRLLVLLDGSLDVDFDHLVSFIGEVNGFNVITTTA